MSEPQPEVKIIKKKGRYAASHGGGPWMMAHADLMAAMMAFFTSDKEMNARFI